MKHTSLPARVMPMVNSLLTLGFAVGTGYFALFSFPTLVSALIDTGRLLLFAQGAAPDFSAKDWANLGGFATFAIAMYVMHRQTLKDFRDDLKEERALRERHAAALSDNTQATRSLTDEIRRK
jgi:membrane associated rhomboid family serine protease